MVDTNISPYERETIILLNESEKNATIYTCSQKTLKKLDELVESYPDIYKVVKETTDSKTYSCPKKMIKFRKPVFMSEERKQKAIEHLRSITEKRKNGGE